MSVLPPPIAVSTVLRETVTLKAEELASAKATFKGRYDDNAEVNTGGKDTLSRLNEQLERIKSLDPYLERDDDLRLLARYVEQARDDRSVSEDKLLRLEKDLKDKLVEHTCRLEVSELHVDLLKEAIDKGDETTSLADKMEKAALEDEFEMVEGGLEDVLDKFEKHTFTTKEVHIEAVEEYLNNLFDNTAAQEQLRRLRQGLETYGEDVMTGQEEVDEDMVQWCIADLVKNELVSDEKKKTLQGYLQSPIALREITGTLNMKSVRHWQCRGADKGLPVTARMNGEGKYCIAVEEEIVDMLFLHSLAVGWSVKLRECLKEAVSFKGVWPGNKLLTPDELEQREYYLQAPRPLPSKSCSTCHPLPPTMPPMPPMPPMSMMHYPPVASVPRSRRRHGLPMPPPPPPPRVHGKYKKKETNRYPCPPPPPPPECSGGLNLNDERYRNYIRNFFLSRLPKRVGCTPESVSSDETQAELLKTLATELRFGEAFDGSVHGLTANFESFASSLPHQTILTVLKFLGVPELWLDIFTRFLSAPLNMGPIVRGTSDQILARKRGVPLGHGFETFFTEALLFFLDLATHQKTNAYLFRLRDNCYFVGKEQERNDVLCEINSFAKVMGLNVHTMNSLDTQPIGLLRLATTPVAISIDNVSVDKYARRVKKQLKSCTAVISWIRTWNSTIGTYAAHHFGPLASVFGKAHLDAVTKAYNRIHELIFDGSNLTAHMKNLLATHLGRTLTDPPLALEAIMYLPLAYGGLGVKNPYITLNLVRHMMEHPEKEIESYLEQEKNYYEAAKDTFNSMTPEKQGEKLSALFHDNKARITTVLGADVDPTKFWTYEAFTQTRVRAQVPFLPLPPYPLPYSNAPIPNPINTYTMLLNPPLTIAPNAVSDKIADEVGRLAGKLDMRRLYKLSDEELWTLQLYGDECFERYGGLEVWHGESVPRDVLKLVRGAVGGEDDGGDDDSSVSSDMTDV